MGIFDFVKSAGASIFGSSAEEKQAEADAQAKANYEAMMADRKAAVAQALRTAIEAHGFSTDGVDISFDPPDARVTLSGSVDTNETREKIILLVGNVEGVAQVDDQLTVENPEPEATFHTVVRGDTLSKIAKAVYGDPMKYPVIFEANKPMLKDPDLIYPGQVLRIPPA
ncbi:MAG: peptidoglycan-binding protein LysM [Myxococcota bacterium]